MLGSAAPNTTLNTTLSLNNTTGELRRDETVDILTGFPLYPYGVEQGDVLLSPLDGDRCSEWSMNITLYGRQYSALLVSFVLVNSKFCQFLFSLECFTWNDWAGNKQYRNHLNHDNFVPFLDIIIHGQNLIKSKCCALCCVYPYYKTNYSAE